MIPAQQWILDNMAVVFFFYGLSFVIMGCIVLASPKEDSRFAISRILRLFVAYALVHAPADFLDMRTAAGSGTASVVHDLLTFVSYLFLSEFGRRLLVLSAIRIPWQVLPLLVLFIASAGALSADPGVTMNILIGYGIRFPAGVMSGMGFILYYRSMRKELDSLKVKRYFITAGIAMLVWAFFCGIIRREGSFFPSTFMNYDSFLGAVGLPVHLFRTLCAMLVTWSLWGMLRIFVYEARERLKQEIAVRRSTEEKNQALIADLSASLSEVKTLSGMLPICASCKKIRDDKGYWNQIECYIRDHSDAEFSHGICPECAERLYPEYCKPKER